jgi:hypothetical protein
MPKSTCCRANLRWATRAAAVCAAALLIVGCGDSRDLGSSIYRDGIGLDGPLGYTEGPAWLAFTDSGCAVCHGESGEGLTARAGDITGTAPPVTYATLTEKGYSDQAIRRAITDGVAHNGAPLHHYMPRWDLTEEELDALVDHLKKLSD